MKAFVGTLATAVCCVAISSTVRGSVLPTVTTYSVSGYGWVGENGDQAVTTGVGQNSILFSQSTLANGGKTLSGSTSIGVIIPGATHFASAEGYAIAEPGRLGAKVSGLATLSVSTLDDGPVAYVRSSATAFEIIPITHPTLPQGTLVDFVVRYGASGTTASEIPGTGPYYSPTYIGLPFYTGLISVSMSAFTRDKVTNGSTSPTVSRSYSAPTTGTPLPLLMEFSDGIPMQGKVGDLLVINSSLGVQVQDRAYKGHGTYQSSELDFSHSVNVSVEAITPGLVFQANGHNYASVPEPATLMLGCAGAALLLVRRGRQRSGYPRVAVQSPPCREKPFCLPSPPDRSLHWARPFCRFSWNGNVVALKSSFLMPTSRSFAPLKEIACCCSPTTPRTSIPWSCSKSASASRRTSTSLPRAKSLTNPAPGAGFSSTAASIRWSAVRLTATASP